MPLLQESQREDVSTVGAALRMVREGLQQEARAGGLLFGGRWTLRSVAKRAGINPAHISNFENGSSSNKRVTISFYKVARQYHINDDDIENFATSKMPDGSTATEATLKQWAENHVKKVIAEKGEAWLFGETVIRGDARPSGAQLEDMLINAERNNPEAFKLLWDRFVDLSQPKKRKKA